MKENRKSKERYDMWRRKNKISWLYDYMTISLFTCFFLPNAKKESMTVLIYVICMKSRYYILYTIRYNISCKSSIQLKQIN